MTSAFPLVLSAARSSTQIRDKDDNRLTVKNPIDWC